MVKTTKEQRAAIYRKWRQNDQTLSYRQFRQTVQPGIFNDCLMVLWSGMWLGIESDGHTHSQGKSMETSQITVGEIREIRSVVAQKMRRQYPGSFVTDCSSYSVRAYINNDEKHGDLESLADGTWPPKRAEIDNLLAENSGVDNIWIEGRMDTYENLWEYNNGGEPNFDASEYWVAYLKGK